MTLLLRDVESLYTQGVVVMVTDSLKYHSVELLVCLLLLLMRETLEMIGKVSNTTCWQYVSSLYVSHSTRFQNKLSVISDV